MWAGFAKLFLSPLRIRLEGVQFGQRTEYLTTNWLIFSREALERTRPRPPLTDIGPLLPFTSLNTTCLLDVLSLSENRV
jgi:hypothetical protein